MFDSVSWLCNSSFVLAYVKFIEKVRIRSHNAEMACSLNQAVTIYMVPAQRINAENDVRKGSI